MNTVFAQPNLSQAYRPLNLSMNGLPSMGQGMYIARPNTGAGGSSSSASSGGPRPAVPGQAAVPGGSFIDRLVSQVEQLVERVVLNLVERVLGGVFQKLESALGLGTTSSPLGATSGGSPARDIAGLAAATAGGAEAPAPGSMLVDLPPLQLTVTQTNSQNQTSNVTQPEEGGGFLSTVFDVLGGIGDTIGSLWGKAKDVGTSVVGGLISKATSFFGF